MKERRKKTFKIISIIISLFALIVVFDTDKEEKVVFLAVGQGDASLISTKGRTILIDGGPSWQVLLELPKVLKYKMKISDIVITHPHSDHYFGLAEIINRYKVDNIYYYDKNKGNDIFEIFLNNIKTKDINLINVKRGDRIRLRSNCYLYFLWPREEESKGSFDKNELSIVNYFSCGKVKILFTGDISGVVEKQLISMNKSLKFAVLKAGHHGSNKSNSWDFLSFYSPKKIVISAGKDNKYGLPSPEVISRAKALKIKVENLIEGKSYEILIK
ncbi:MAG TPA: MBL fold metallo-hydrolase [Patescibacteria group bacterium]|nr:MBL fold metallo-hydrolase [Patescibacteria group bacterium]